MERPVGDVRGQRGDYGVVGAFAGLEGIGVSAGWVEAEIGAAVLEGEAAAGRDDGGAEAAVVTVDEGDAVAGVVGDGEVDRVAVVVGGAAVVEVGGGVVGVEEFCAYGEVVSCGEFLGEGDVFAVAGGEDVWVCYPPGCVGEGDAETFDHRVEVFG